MASTTAVEAGRATWQLDPAHSSVEFSVKHMMMTTVRGRFKEVTATLTGDRDHPEDAGLQVSINAASIDTGVADRDAHLRGPDFFDAENFPDITFRFKRIDGNPPKEEGDRFRVVGDLRNAAEAHHGCVVLHHPVLAGSAADARQVADAVAKVFRHREQLCGFGA